jgi:hypothetical protein
MDIQYQIHKLDLNIVKDSLSESNILSGSCDSLLMSSVTAALELSTVESKDDTGK